MKVDVKVPSGWRLILNERDEGDFQIGLVDPDGRGRFSIVKATAEDAIVAAERWLIATGQVVVATVLGALARWEVRRP
jgi:hypothetical protein